MIDVYSWATPNGHKVHILLEELGLPYQVHPVDIGAGDQFKPEFLRISPNNKVPALVDSDGPDGKPIALFESGAILIYLAEKYNRFVPADPRERYEMLQWLMFQMAGIGPMLGQAHHFRIYAPEPVPYAIDRYTKEAKRLYGVLDRRLAEHQWVGCNEYSIADMAIWPWLRSWKNQGIEMTDFPNVAAWFEKIDQREAVQRGVKVLTELRKPLLDETARRNLFGDQQYARRS
jgi:GST-like protein